MSDREKKAQLKNRIERFLYGQVSLNEEGSDEIRVLKEIVDELVALKFEGGSDQCVAVVSDPSKEILFAVKVPHDGSDKEACSYAAMVAGQAMTSLATIMSSEIDCTIDQSDQ